MFVAWSGIASDSTSTSVTTQTLSAQITLNLYNTKLDTVNTFKTSGEYYNFMPYLTFMNSDSASIVTRNFDAWVFPITIAVSTDTLTMEMTTTTYNMYDWVASDYNTLTSDDATASGS